MKKIYKYKKCIKIIIVFIISLGILFLNTYYKSMAFSFKDLTGTPFTNSEAKSLSNRAVTFVSTIGSIVSVITLVVLGVKYMLGSAEEKAEYRTSLIPYMIGAGIVFTASTIAGIVYKVAVNF